MGVVKLCKFAAVLVCLSVLGIMASLPAYAALSYGKFSYGDEKYNEMMEVARQRIKVNCPNCNGEGHVRHYCVGCHDGVVVGITVIGLGVKTAPRSTYDEWVARIERMSFVGCHIPPELIPDMAAYLDGLQQSPEAKAAQAAQAAATAAKVAGMTRGQMDVENYCTGCHNGLVVGSTVIGAGKITAEPKTYDGWMYTVKKMSQRESVATPLAAGSGTGAHIPPELMPAMAAYLFSLEDVKAEKPQSVNSISSNDSAQIPEQDPASKTVQRVCTQCHNLEVAGNCVTEDCTGLGKPVIRRKSTPPWNMVLDWMASKGARFTEGERQEMLAYLQKNYPAKAYSLPWERVNAFAGQGGWNITLMAGHKDFLYAGFEGNGKIFRSADGTNWKEVLSTGQYTAYGLASFKGALYAAAGEPTAQVWSSADDGLSWQLRASLPQNEVGIQTLGVFKNHLYVGTATSSLYRSVDGSQWEKITTLKGDDFAGLINWTRFLIPFKGYFFAGIEEGPLFRSTDGLTWIKVSGEINNNRGFRGATIFKGEFYVGTTRGGGIWKTSDGKTWKRVFKAAIEPGYVASMAVVGKYLFASVNGYVFQTMDGAAWEEIGRLAPAALEAMAGWRDTLYVGAIMAPDSHIYWVKP